MGLKFIGRCVQASLVTAASICIASCYFIRKPFIGKREVDFESDHFDGRKFRNLSGNERTLVDFFQWLSRRDALPWPKKVDAKPQVVPEPRIPKEECRVTFINHSTVLLQWEGLNILTDPVWCDRASPFRFAGPKRVIQPGVKLTDLPRLDLILVSHNHYDHMDVATLKQLSNTHQAPILTGLGNRAVLEKNGIGSIRELDWWESSSITKELEVVYVPAEHFSSRGLFDKNEALWGGFILRAPSGVIYFAGDTGYGPHFKEIRTRFGPIRLAMLPIGAYKPEWFMSMAHNSPIDSVQAHQDLEAHVSLAIHWDTFHLGEESYDDPPKVFHQEARRRGLSVENFWVMTSGDVRTLSEV